MEEKCKTCNGTGHINKSWSAGGGRIGYNQWLEDCPKCGPFAVAMEELNELLAIEKEAEGMNFEIKALGKFLK